MIVELIQQGIDGAKTILKSTEDLYQQILDEKGEQAPVGFPDTAYYLPLAYGFLGEKAAYISDLSRILVRSGPGISGTSKSRLTSSLLSLCDRGPRLISV